VKTTFSYTQSDKTLKETIVLTRKE
jgi:hypothetical protein